MKTNRFEEILRRKLESLNPDFQAQDWDKFQAFQQHAAPSFWQTYGQWLGYAVAVVTTGVMVTLYVSQSRQNDVLLREMKKLREQIVAGSGTGWKPVVADSLVTTDWKPRGEPFVPQPHSDTVYIIQPRVIYRDRPVYEKRAELAESSRRESLNLKENFDRQKSENPEKPVVGNIIQENAAQDSPLAANESGSRFKKSEATRKSDTDVPPFDKLQSKSGETLPIDDSPGDASPGDVSPKATLVPADIQPKDRLTQDRLVLDEIQSLPAPSLPEAVKTEYRRLINRMPRAVRKQENPVVAKSEKASESKAAPSKPASTESVEKATEDESLLPKFGLNLPFRVGAGQQWEGRTKAFSLWNEVLLGAHWSAQAGLSWQKLEDQKFFDERGFKEKMRKEFRKNHAEKLPPSFDIFNITARTKVIRIPLNLTYRNEISNGFSYFVGAGTNVNLQAKQTLSFDFKRPSRDFGQESKQRNIPFPLINNMNALVGVEKRWSPIVLQVSSFLNTRFKTFPFLDDRTDVGMQVKLLYEFKAGTKK